MTRLNRILSILSLLNHRRSVSLRTISRTIGTTDRTAYRYLNELSEANVPLFHDRSAGGYRLTRPLDVALPTFSDNEMIVLTTALMLTRRHLNSDYRTTLDSVVSKLSIRQRLPLERIVETHRETTPVEVAHPDYSSEFTTAIFGFAVAEKRGMKVVTSDPKETQRTLSVRSPSMVFRQSWHLSGIGTSGQEDVDFRTIRGVTVGDKSQDSG
jgi:predicted DNA-binding transcriptional regulator YafY